MKPGSRRLTSLLGVLDQLLQIVRRQGKQRLSMDPPGSPQTGSCKSARSLELSAYSAEGDHRFQVEGDHPFRSKPTSSSGLVDRPGGALGCHCPSRLSFDASPVMAFRMDSPVSKIL
jgi:hypothetical protein